MITMRMRPSTAATLAVILAFGIGFRLGRAGTARTARTPFERNSGGFSFIQPLLDCAPQDGSFQEILPVKRDLEVAIAEEVKAGNVSQVSVYYRNLNLGPWLGIEQEARFAPASLLKVPLMMAYLKLAEEDPSLLSRRAVYQEQPIGFPQLIEPEVKLKAGKEYTVEEYLEAMIARSDNQAAYLLLTHLAPERLQQAYNGLGLKAPEAKSPTDWITVHEYASFFRILYNATYLNRQMSEKALSLLSRSTFKQGLVGGVPGQTTVSHKFGERREEGTDMKQLHDCGIVYHPRSPYLLCMMSRGRDLQTMLAVLRSLSAAVWKDVDAQTRPGSRS